MIDAILPVVHRQTVPYGCGLYAVANSCNFPEIITPERIEESRIYGNTIGQLSKWMQQSGKNFYIEVLHYDHLADKLPERHFDWKPIGEVDFLPVVLTVRLSEAGLNHMIGGKIDKEGTFYLYDSLKETVKVTKLSELNNLYHNVYGLFIFADVETGDYAFI